MAFILPAARRHQVQPSQVGGPGPGARDAGPHCIRSSRSGWHRRAVALWSDCGRQLSESGRPGSDPESESGGHPVPVTGIMMAGVSQVDSLKAAGHTGTRAIWLVNLKLFPSSTSRNGPGWARGPGRTKRCQRNRDPRPRETVGLTVTRRGATGQAACTRISLSLARAAPTIKPAATGPLVQSRPSAGADRRPPVSPLCFHH